MNSSKKYICDTNILLSSLISSSSPLAQTVDFIKDNGLFSFSKETFSEFEEVLKRPKFDKFLSKERRLNFKADICRDPKDNKFLDIAIASYAEFLITGDEDLLILERIEKTSIISPRNFVDIL